MSASKLREVADLYRRRGAVFGIFGHVGPMLAHRDAASLCERAACAIEAADLATTRLEWLSETAASPEIRAFYQPASETVAVWTGSDLIEFGEDEAEALSAALLDALAARKLGRSLTEQCDRVSCLGRAA